MRDYGYDISDYTAIDPLFGTLADFDAVVAECHRLGLMIIVDQVYSHTSTDHAWFAESRARPHQPQGRLVRLGRSRSRTARRPPTGWRRSAAACGSGSRGGGSTILHNFLPSQPDLEPAQHRGSGRHSGGGAVLAGPGRGRVPARRRQLLHPRPGACATIRPRAPGVLSRPYFMQKHLYDRDQAGDLRLRRAPAGAHRRDPARLAAAGSCWPNWRRTIRKGAIADYTLRRGPLPHRLCVPLPRQAVRGGGDPPGGRGPAGARAGSLALLGLLQPRLRAGGLAVGRRTGRAVSQDAAHAADSLRGTAFMYQGEELGLPQAEVPQERAARPRRHRLLARLQGPRRVPHADAVEAGPMTRWGSRAGGRTLAPGRSGATAPCPWIDRRPIPPRCWPSPAAGWLTGARARR